MTKNEIRIEDESGDKKYFTIIPNYILNHSTLWDREVYIQMKRITGEDGTCWTSQSRLAKQCGISINRLKKSIKYLIEHKWIKFKGKKIIQTKGGSQEVNEYSVSDLWKMNNNFYEAKGVSPDDTPYTKGVSRNEQRGITDEAKGVSPDDDKEELLNKNPINKNQEEYTPSFLSFYENYPKKELKKTSFQIWQRKKLEQHLQVILDFIKKARETDRWQKGYIKQPPAFLNGECWNDDLSAYGDQKTTTVLKSSNPNKYDKFKIN